MFSARRECKKDCCGEAIKHDVELIIPTMAYRPDILSIYTSYLTAGADIAVAINIAKTSPSDISSFVAALNRFQANFQKSHDVFNIINNIRRRVVDDELLLNADINKCPCIKIDKNVLANLNNLYQATIDANLQVSINYKTIFTITFKIQSAIGAIDLELLAGSVNWTTILGYLTTIVTNFSSLVAPDGASGPFQLFSHSFTAFDSAVIAYFNAVVEAGLTITCESVTKIISC